MRKRISRFKKCFYVFMAAVLIFSFSSGAFAAATSEWPVFQGNENHDGQITNGQPPTAAPGQITQLTLPNTGGSIFNLSGIDVEPVMQTVNGNTYAYVLYNAYAVSGDDGGARIAKIRCNPQAEQIIWTKQISPSGGFQLSTPLLVQGPDPTSDGDDVIYAAVNGFSQLLDNPELYAYQPNPWTVNTGSDIIWNNGSIRIIDENTAILSQDNVPFLTSSNRVAVGVAVQSDDQVTARSLDLKITFSIDSVAIVSQDFPNTDQPEPLLNEDDGRYYYYLNENFEYPAVASEDVTVSVQVVQNPEDATVSVEYAELYEQLSSIQKITELDQNPPNNVSIVPGVTGQLNTPLTKYGDYLYFGSFGGDNYYYQYSLTSEQLKHTPAVVTFYWAGAIVVNDGNADYVVFGGDNANDKDPAGGYLHFRSVADFENVGGVYDLSQFMPSGASAAGSVRSSISSDGKFLYFTSQGVHPTVPADRNGYIWRADIRYITNLDTNTLTNIPLDRISSTSTPAIAAQSGIIYVGLYQSGGGYGEVRAYSQSSFTYLATVYSGSPIQSSPIVWSDRDKEIDYIYFTGNDSRGSAFFCSFDLSSMMGNTIWSRSSGNYALQGFASEAGHLVYGNDSDTLCIFHQ